MKVRKNSLSNFVLTVLEKAVDAGVRLDDFATNTHLYAYYGWRELSKSGLSKALVRLRANGLIEEVQVGSGLIYKLSDEGRMIIAGEPANWDGYYRVVIFDIPEQKRLVRDLFRRNLKKWGFKPLQKSVWISKMDCFRKLRTYISDLGIGQWVLVMEARELSNSLP